MAATRLVRVRPRPNRDVALEHKVNEVIRAIRKTIAESQAISEQARDLISDIQASRAFMQRHESDADSWRNEERKA